MTKDEELSLGYELKNPYLTKERKSEIEEKFFLQYKGMIYNIANKLKAKTKTHIEINELFQVGCLSFIENINKYDYNRKCKLGTYIYRWVYKSISEAINENKTIRKINESTHYQIFQIKKTIMDFNHEIGETNDLIDKISNEMNISKSIIKKLLILAQGKIIIDDLLNNEGIIKSEVPFNSIIHYNNLDNNKIETKLELNSIVVEQISRLKPHQKELILHMFPGIMKPTISYKTLLESQGWSDDDVKKEWIKIKRTLKSYKSLNEIAEKRKQQRKQQE